MIYCFALWCYSLGSRPGCRVVRLVAIREGAASRLCRVRSIPGCCQAVALHRSQVVAFPFFYRCNKCNISRCSIGHGLAGRRHRSQGRNCKNQIFKTQLFSLPKWSLFALKILTITNLHYFSTLHFFLFNIIKVIGQNSLFRNSLTFNKLENNVH